MIYKIAQTFVSKVLTALLSFLLVIITARYGGSVVRGEISLFVTNQAVIMLFASIIGGPSIIYLSSKVNTGSLFVLSYIWSLAMALLISLVILYLGFVSYEYFYFLLVISILSCLFSVNTHFLLGLQKINVFNMLTIFQVLVLFISTVYFFIVKGNSDLYYYVISMTISYGILFLASLFYLLTIKKDDQKRENKNWTYYLKTGATAQFSNIIQFLNYRLSYYYIALLLSEENLGLFSTCVILTEATWLISSSLATVGYTKISAEKDNEASKKIAFQLFRLNIILTLVPVLILALIPDSYYLLIFGKDFQNIRGIILIMLAGAFMISMQRIMSTYFSGIGKFHINNWAALLGLAFNTVLLYLLLSNYQLTGVAIASTITYLVIFSFSFYNFRSITGIRLADLKPDKTDFDLAV